jgi:DNA-3-methyladenine glycosylase
MTLADRRPLPRAFFSRPTVDVARGLVGCTLWAESGGALVAGRIVEVEAYLGEGRDPASHAHRGATPRAAVMFGPPAVAYIYFIYGMHHGFNIVTEPAGHGGAVLVRALEPLAGVDAMRARRPGCRGDEELCAGPGRLCRALGLDLAWNGQPLGISRKTEANNPAVGRVWVAAGHPPAELVATSRVGIRLASDWPMRFCDPASASLSRPCAGRG